MLRTILQVLFFGTSVLGREPPMVTIPGQGTVMGKEISRFRSQKIIGYFGIPYAAPPLDNLRFAPPDTENLENWEGVLNATEYKPACLQTEKDLREEAKPFLQIIFPSYSELETNENCLYLNVFVPSGTPPTSGFATIVWIHPGNFTTGSPSMWNPHILVYRYRIILVTFAWRLSIMGFFTTGDGESPGNFGLMDQQAAMMWTKKNIKHFGGDDNNISLMGYGTGGTCVGLHMVNQRSREYFHKAIVMSGNFLTPTVVKDPKEDQSLLDQLASSTGCIRRPTSHLIDCLRQLDGKPLVDQTSNINWRPLLDSNLSNSTFAFLPDLPKNFFERGDFHKVPFLTGHTNMEDILAYTNLIDEFATANISNENLEQILTEITNADLPVNNNTECPTNYEHITNTVMFFYTPAGANSIKDIDSIREIIAEFTTEKYYAASTFSQASFVSKERPTYVYRFDLKPSTSWVAETLPDWVSVPHLYDLIYIWGIPFWQEFSGANNWETRDKRISEIMMSFWTNFAKTSNPTNGSLYAIKWERFTPDNPQILIMDGAFNMSNTAKVNYKAFEFWNSYFPKVMQLGTQCCSTQNDDAFNMFANDVLITLLLCLTQVWRL